ncbi:binding-protein-dependent transport systems inner membrane component [Alicyclobacillus acidocaldarius subsp. acidocaldarius Tc-4-1]|uniref:Binding-protein-dependent transport systems inner membrane component n=2 Tax=Alicyclobacillus acidocaldarius TaxID=405212 RepID=F8IEJ2_ALIAT|nr:binding-protein-dependent transport systems inner membrane component [Alicyclobacillus acidocaldarius subsp. acidocaldarius Tc-4-1]
MSMSVTDAFLRSPAQSVAEPSPRPSRLREGLLAACLLAPAFVFLVAFVYAPAVLAFALAFFNFHPGGTATYAGLSNFHAALSDPLFWRSMANTGLYALMMVPSTLVLSVALAALLQSNRRLFRFAQSLVVLPYITPAVGTAIGWLWMYNPNFGILNALLRDVGLRPIGWLNSPHWAMPAVVLYSLWHGIGFDVLILLSAMSQLPEGVLESARMDGAGPWTRLFRITLPLISPTLFFIAVMTTIGSLQAFAQVYALSLSSGGPENATLTALLYIYQQAFTDGQFSYAAAMAAMLVVCIFAVTALTRWIGHRFTFYQ